MKKFCDGHPTRKAHWHCSKCSALLCPECVVERGSESYGQTKTEHFCPKCNLPVDWIGVQNLIDPFWNRMPRIFSYPVSMQPLILMFVIFYFLLIRPQQKRTKEHRQMLSNLKKGDRIVTSGGIHGRITGMDDVTLTVEIADKVRVKVARGNVANLAQTATQNQAAKK